MPHPPSPAFAGLLPRHWRPIDRVVAAARFASLSSIFGKSSGFGLQVARVRPLELRFQRTVDLPIDVAEMIVDGRVVGLQFDGALEVLHRFVIIAEPVIGPAERVDDVAVVGPLLDGALDHVHALVEMDALVDPGIAEIVEHLRLVGIKLAAPS